jgi:glutamate-5-semialdehyde dehydrogenase
MTQPGTLANLMLTMGANARKAARQLRSEPAAKRDAALLAMAKAIRARTNDILAENASDLAALKDAHATPAFADRLTLNTARIEAMAKGLEDVAARPDPLHRTLDTTTRPNGLEIARVSVPIGVIGIVYESRPNVTADAGALCLKSGNAVILRGGSEALASSKAIFKAMQEGLAAAGLTLDAIQLVEVTDRAAVGHLLGGLNGAVDLIIPRGGKGLTKRVQDEARVPVLAHLEGVNHVYIAADADPQMACQIVLNAKMRRVSVCGAAETVLLDARTPDSLKRDVIQTLLDNGCAVRGDAGVMSLDPRVTAASENDWYTEYLDAVMSARIIDGVHDAIAHIETYGSQHTDAIVTSSPRNAQSFFEGLDSAILMWNASTQFADGAEFGLGAEIGIGTGRMHARGPVGADQLTIYKYIVRGHGHIRP